MVQKAQFPNESALAPGLIDELLGGWTLWPFRWDLAAPRMGTDVQDPTRGPGERAPRGGPRDASCHGREREGGKGGEKERGREE